MLVIVIEYARRNSKTPQKWSQSILWKPPWADLSEGHCSFILSSVNKAVHSKAWNQYFECKLDPHAHQTLSYNQSSATSRTSKKSNRGFWEELTLRANKMAVVFPFLLHGYNQKSFKPPTSQRLTDFKGHALCVCRFFFGKSS